MEAAYKTHIGCIRALNEDSGAVLELANDCLVAVVADGMGGHQAGNVASLMAVDVIKLELAGMALPANPVQASDMLEQAIRKANEAIYQYSLSHEECHGMGTTIAASILGPDWLVIGHIGDSRIYRVSGDRICQLTEDHSLVNELLKNGQISHEEAHNHPQRNVLLRALGTNETVQLEIKAMEWDPHDVLLVCSDGLSNKVHTHDMIRIINTSHSPANAVDRLIDLALEQGGEDNITAIVIGKRQPPLENEVT